MPDAIPTSLPQEKAAKNLSVVRIQRKEYLILCTHRRGVANTCI